MLDQVRESSNSGPFDRDRTKFRLSCSDGTEYESEDLKYFRQGAEIDTKRAESIRFSFRSGSDDRAMTIDLRHGAVAGAITVVGDSGFEDWIAIVSSKISEKIRSLEPSQSWLVRRSGLLWILLSSLFVLGFMLLLYTLFRVLAALGWMEIPTNDADLVMYFEGFGFRGWSLGIWWAALVMLAGTVRDWILEAWPSIDLSTGPKHLRSEKLRRKRLVVFWTSIVTPLLWLLAARAIG